MMPSNFLLLSHVPVADTKKLGTWHIVWPEPIAVAGFCLYWVFGVTGWTTVAYLIHTFFWYFYVLTDFVTFVYSIS